MAKGLWSSLDVKEAPKRKQKKTVSKKPPTEAQTRPGYDRGPFSSGPAINGTRKDVGAKNATKVKTKPKKPIPSWSGEWDFMVNEKTGKTKVIRNGVHQRDIPNDALGKFVMNRFSAEGTSVRVTKVKE